MACDIYIKCKFSAHKEFYWNTAILICLPTIYGCFLIPATKLNSCNRGHMAHKAGSNLSLYRKTFPNPGIHDSVNRSLWRSCW